MFVAWIAASALLAAGPPKAPPSSQMRCDVTVEFRAKSGEIDEVVYRAIKTWLNGQPSEVVSFEETTLKKNSRAKFCIATQSDEATEAAFNTVRRYMFVGYSGKGSITLKSRRGGLAQAQPRLNSASPSRVPRDNGINNRPPIGNRN